MRGALPETQKLNKENTIAGLIFIRVAFGFILEKQIQIRSESVLSLGLC